MSVTMGWDPAEYEALRTRQRHEQEAPQTFPATSLRSRSLTAIPPRPWIYGRELVRGFVSVLGSPGGTGKTAFVIAVALSIATGRSLLSALKTLDIYKQVHKTGAVWLYNLEDPADEMDRRLAAALKHYEIDFDAVADSVYVDSGRDRPLVITKRMVDGTLIKAPIVSALVDELKARQITLLVIDPFVQSHTAEENRNEEMNLVMAEWGKVANEAQCAVWLIHHFRKGGQSGDAESFRGAAAIQGAARVMSTLSAMSAEEAGKLGVDEGERWQYIRRDNAKANMAPRPSDAEWYRLASVSLENGNDEYPQGDFVQVVETWAPPSPWDGIPWSLIVRMLDKIDAGPEPGRFYAAAKQATHWCGKVVMDVAQRQEGQAAIIIKAWLDNGVLVKDTYKSPDRKNADTACVRVDRAKVAEMRRAIYGEDEGAD